MVRGFDEVLRARVEGPRLTIAVRRYDRGSPARLYRVDRVESFRISLLEDNYGA